MKNFIFTTLCFMGVFAPLAQADALYIKQDGYILENQTITDYVFVQADDVIIRNCQFLHPALPEDGASWYTIRNTGTFSDGTPWSKNLLIEDCIIQGAQSATISVTSAIVRNCIIREAGHDAVKAGSNVIFEGNHVSRIGKMQGSVHADGFQMTGGSNVVIKNNIFDLGTAWGAAHGYKQDACLMLQDEFQDLHHITITGNYFNGGSYSVYINHKDDGPSGQTPHHIRLNGNTWGRDRLYGTVYPDLQWEMDPTNIQINGNFDYDGTSIPANLWDGTPW